MTYPLSTLGPTIDANGISIPSYNDVLQSLIASFQLIYGTDIYVEPDSQDGQWLAVLAKSIDDSNQAAVAVFQAFSPTYAQGVGLSSLVKINGIRRLVASKSTVIVTLVGQAGSLIINGMVTDTNGHDWNLPASVTIPIGGSINVTATAVTDGSIAAAPGTVTKIKTPTLGWQSVTNSGSATPGNPVETDPELRGRQTQSVALPSLTVLAGIVGAISNLTGVEQVKGYENDTGSTDSDGLPPHSISMVVQGGDATAIATAIMNKKTPGAYTYGDIEVDVVDSVGIPHAIRFYAPTEVPITVEVTLHALTGYSSAIATDIKAAIAAYINGLKIGQDVMITRLYVPAQLNGSSLADTFEIVSVLAAASPGSPSSSDVSIEFNELATCDVADISIVVV